MRISLKRSSLIKRLRTAFPKEPVPPVINRISLGEIIIRTGFYDFESAIQEKFYSFFRY